MNKKNIFCNICNRLILLQLFDSLVNHSLVDKKYMNYIVKNVQIIMLNIF